MEADAVDDDARQDEDHAREPNEMRQLLGAELRMVVMADRCHVDDDVERSTDGHDDQAEQRCRWKRSKAASHLYREHGLVIHGGREPVNCNGNRRM
jgi:hypothetical protein